MVKNLNYGIIGNCRSSALVSEQGSIDWCCLPDPDSPAVFARLVDYDKGGHFSIVTQNEYIINQTYQGNTNVLITSFTNEFNAFEIIDFMPRYMTEDGNYYNSPEIFRILKVLKGKPVVRVEYNPQLNFASAETKHVVHQDFIKSFTVKRSLRVGIPVHRHPFPADSGKTMD